MMCRRYIKLTSNIHRQHPSKPDSSRSWPPTAQRTGSKSSVGFPMFLFHKGAGTLKTIKTLVLVPKKLFFLRWKHMKPFVFMLFDSGHQFLTNQSGSFSPSSAMTCSHRAESPKSWSQSPRLSHHLTAESLKDWWFFSRGSKANPSLGRWPCSGSLL